MMDNRWLSADEIADYLNIKRSTVYKWIETRNIPAHKFGHVWKFRMKEIVEWVHSIDTEDGESEKGNTSIPECKMTLRDTTYLNARLNIKWNWRIFIRSFGNC